MASQGDDVYATLLLNDTYLPGALVLAHSLKDAGTTKKLAVLVTVDGVSADAMVELQKLFDFIIPVERVLNDTPANLFLMGRPDLQSTFTKITLWKQTQFRKIVYMDADMVALRAPDELFNITQPFSAAPDIGWPDIFNTGLMVLNPNMSDYYSLLAMAERGISFDGADQGLLNMHFKNTYNRLSFTYNVTPSAHYQYLPAYRHFQSSISAAHFIGQNKPWSQGREANKGTSPYDEMVGRWWSVYDRHYRESSLEVKPVAPIIQYYTKGEFYPATPEASSIQEGQSKETEGEVSHPDIQAPVGPQHEQEAIEGENTVHEEQDAVPDIPNVPGVPEIPVEAEESKVQEQRPKYSVWDASKAPPPMDSKPEAHSFPATHYEMSSDPTPWRAPERFPDPPKDMYYEVPKTPTYQKPAPIFPWEKNASKPSRVFPEDTDYDFGVTREVQASSNPSTPPRKDDSPIPDTPGGPSISVTPAEPWESFTRGNAWDEIPEIERYIGKLQKNRKGNIQALQGYVSSIDQTSSEGETRRQSLKLTDFPTELERPSLPVTPAPIRRPKFWGSEGNDGSELPQAEGVPSAPDWDPVAQLEQLAQQQSDVLASKLKIGRDGGHIREIPMRPLPYGSERLISPTYVAQASISSSIGIAESPRTPQVTIEEPNYGGPAIAWEKDESYLQQETPMPPTEEELDVLET